MSIKDNMYKTIIIANGAETFKKILNRCPIEERENKINIEHNLCERAFFWEDDNKLILTPYPIHTELLNKNIHLLGYSKVANISPDKIDISLSEAITNDNILWKQLTGIIKNNPDIKISPYAFTEELFGLIQKLKSENLVFNINEMPRLGSEWLVSYLNSKSGFRSEMLKIQGMFDSAIIPEGFICTNMNEAIKVAEWFYRQSKSSILKIDDGESGWGQILVKKEKFVSASDINKYIELSMANDGIWDETLIVVEEYIVPNVKDEYCSPSVEIFINDHSFEITHSGSQILGDHGDFKGIVLGKGSICEPIKSRIYQISFAVGQRYFELGYKGYFDIDFIIASDKHVYAIETNTRRTGSTHVFDLARKLFDGNSWESDFHIFSQDSYLYANKLIPINTLFNRMKNLLFPIKNEKKGIVITHIGKHLPIMGFVIVSTDAIESRKIYSEYCSLWGENILML